MRKSYIILLLSLLMSLLLISSAYAANSISGKVTGIERLFGTDRYQTAKKIAERNSVNAIDSVVLVPGNSYANALTASVLAYKQNAPLLLVGNSIQNSKEALDYIVTNLNPKDNIYLVYDKDLITGELISKIKELGFNKITMVVLKAKKIICRLFLVPYSVY